MTVEAGTLEPQDIPEYVHEEADTLAENYRDRQFGGGEGLGVLACAIAVVDGDIELGRAFATTQLGLISRGNLQPYEEADVWKYLAWSGDKRARNRAWKLLDGAVEDIKQHQSTTDKATFRRESHYPADETADRARWLIKYADKRPRSTKRARDMAKLASEAGVPKNLGLLYADGDKKSLDEELRVFDADVLDATEDTIRSIRFSHESVLCGMAIEAIAHSGFKQADKILRRLTNDHMKAEIYAALLGRGRTEGLPFIEEFVEREVPWEGGWRPRITYALARAGYAPALERLRDSTDVDVVGGEEQHLYAMVDAGLEGARERVLSHLSALSKPGFVLYKQLCELSEHGLEAEALQLVETTYAQKPAAVPAYWIWQHAETPDLKLWQHAYAGAKELKGGDPARPAFALYKLATLATQKAIKE